MTVALWISVVGLVLMLIGYVAMWPPRNPGPGRTDYGEAPAVGDRPWAFWLVTAGAVLGLSGTVSAGLAVVMGWPESMVFIAMETGLLVAAGVWWLVRQSNRYDDLAERTARGEKP